MVLSYLQVSFQYSRLLRLLKMEAHGTIFSHLRFLETVGLSVQVDTGDIEMLRHYLDNGLPLIVAVDTGELRSYWREATGHAVVVVGIERDTVYLNDPEFENAPIAIPLAEFELAWEEMYCRYAVIALKQL
jgi:ABC-type bacteriocin/lantibiotic exporter with double-glycine peptidase domain